MSVGWENRKQRRAVAAPSAARARSPVTGTTAASAAAAPFKKPLRDGFEFVRINRVLAQRFDTYGERVIMLTLRTCKPWWRGRGVAKSPLPRRNCRTHPASSSWPQVAMAVVEGRGCLRVIADS